MDKQQTTLLGHQVVVLLHVLLVVESCIIIIHIYVRSVLPANSVAQALVPAVQETLIQLRLGVHLVKRVHQDSLVALEPLHVMQHVLRVLIFRLKHV